ncbi:MAG: group II intron maturase-specific domain-containing protein [Ectothiorhodospira sp.]
MKPPLEALDQWIRSRMRCVIWRHWKRPRTGRRQQVALGLDEHRGGSQRETGEAPGGMRAFCICAMHCLMAGSPRGG